MIERDYEDYARLYSFPTRRSSDLAMKNVAYLNPEYSVMCPATISDSPSGTSNGVRFDSTRPETKNRMNATQPHGDRKSTRLNSSHRCISYAVFCLKKKTDRGQQHG